ncbi:hypothetical protein CDV55_101077 [Aspergillus turcosus]|uniref:Uncharacterized protein n=1 Tax=Aspergillus turcosus TaxID=1245748 RepID=A0A397IGE1_9EURO|nr:hypothetical protein CDV55_101077 [Aspergillus turcosus]RLM01268.1 hypothetical protein CFD26_101190 [Aspergillus turcosus]
MLGTPVDEVSGRVAGRVAAPPPPGLCGTPGTPVAEVSGRVAGPVATPPPPGLCGTPGTPVAEVSGRVAGPMATPPPPGLCGTPGTPVAEVSGRVAGPADAPPPPPPPGAWGTLEMNVPVAVGPCGAPGPAAVGVTVPGPVAVNWGEVAGTPGDVAKPPAQIVSWDMVDRLASRMEARGLCLGPMHRQARHPQQERHSVPQGRRHLHQLGETPDGQ